MADRLNVDESIRVMALADVGPLRGKDTSEPTPTVKALSGGINAKNLAKAMLPPEPVAPVAPVDPFVPLVPVAPVAPFVPLVAVAPVAPVAPFVPLVAG